MLSPAALHETQQAQQSHAPKPLMVTPESLDAEAECKTYGPTHLLAKQSLHATCPKPYHPSAVPAVQWTLRALTVTPATLDDEAQAKNVDVESFRLRVYATLKRVRWATTATSAPSFASVATNLSENKQVCDNSTEQAVSAMLALGTTGRQVTSRNTLATAPTPIVCHQMVVEKPHQRKTAVPVMSAFEVTVQRLRARPHKRRHTTSDPMRMSTLRSAVSRRSKTRARKTM